MPPQLLVCLTCAALATSLDYATLHSTIRSAHLESWLRPAPAGSNAASGDRIAGAFEAEAERFIGGAKDWIQPGSSEKPFSFTGLHIRQRISSRCSRNGARLSSKPSFLGSISGHLIWRRLALS